MEGRDDPRITRPIEGYGPGLASKESLSWHGFLRIVEEAEVYLVGEFTILYGESRLVAFFLFEGAMYSNSHFMGIANILRQYLLRSDVIPLEAAQEVGGWSRTFKHAG